MGFVKPKDYTLLPNEVEARRKGGHIVHVLALDEDGCAIHLQKAICGNGPKENKYRAFTRAGWYRTLSSVDCPKCLAILKERGNG